MRGTRFKKMPTITETIQKVNEFAQLREGWHFGEGLPPSPERIDQAVNFLEYASFSDIDRVNAFPGIRGQLEITFYSEDRMLEITIESDDSITIAEDCDHEQVSFEENLSKSDAYQRLEEFNQNLWASSDHFIVSILIPNASAVSPAVHWISEAENHSLSSMWSVRSWQAVPYARILRATITNRQAALGFTGGYGIVTFRTPVESYLSERQQGMIVTGTSTIGAGTQFAKHLSE
jgi:hypothetical protein